MKRLRTANRIPVCIETSHLPAERVPGFAAADLDNEVSLYAVLESRYGIRPAGGRSEMTASPVDAEDAELLGLPVGINVLVWRSVVFDETGQPVEYLVSVNHPERVSFTTEHEVRGDTNIRAPV